MEHLDALVADRRILVGMVVAAGVVGWLAERGWDRRLWCCLPTMGMANLLIYALGTAWLAYALQLDAYRAWASVCSCWGTASRSC